MKIDKSRPHGKISKNGQTVAVCYLDTEEGRLDWEKQTGMSYDNQLGMFHQGESDGHEEQGPQNAQKTD